jgi:methionyl aminopeptidase
MASLVSSDLEGSGAPSGESAAPIVHEVSGDKADKEEDGEDGEEGDTAPAGAAKKKKKKKNNNSKKKKKPFGTVVAEGRMLGGFTDYYTKYGQTEPPTKAVGDLFKNGEFPLGEVQKHGVTKYPCPDGGWQARTTEEEKKEKERLERPQLYEKVRHAAEVHRQVRRYAQSFIKPGIELADMCERLENTNRLLMAEKGLEQGVGFPTGCSINEVAAHYTPNNGDRTVLQHGDVMKVDFGTQIEGRIIDCAWTVSFDEKYDPLLAAVKAATETGIRAAGIDVCMEEIGEQIQETMESHEIELNGKTYPIKCCRNLNGHSIGPYQIHAGKSVPIVGGGGDRRRMVEGEFYAIETFGSSGDGYVVEKGECSHYMKEFNAPHRPLKSAKAKHLLSHINKTFSTLAFCRRWLDREDGGSMFLNGTKGRQDNHLAALNELVSHGIVNEYPPLVDTAGVGCYVAQYEHTLLLRPTCKEVLSRGDDY